MQQVIFATYLYYVSKIIDLLDTVIRFAKTCAHTHSCAHCRKNENRYTEYVCACAHSFIHENKNFIHSLISIVWFAFGRRCFLWCEKRTTKSHFCMCTITAAWFWQHLSTLNSYQVSECISASLFSAKMILTMKKLHLNCRQPRYIARCNQFICTCHHVRLLFFDIVPTRTEKLPVVEKAYHTSSIGKQYSGIFVPCVRSYWSARCPRWFPFEMQIIFCTFKN